MWWYLDGWAVADSWCLFPWPRELSSPRPLLPFSFPRNTAPWAPLPNHCKSVMFSNGISQSSKNIISVIYLQMTLTFLRGHDATFRRCKHTNSKKLCMPYINGNFVIPNNKGLFRVKLHSLLLRPGSDNSISLWCKLRHTIDLSNYRSWFPFWDNLFRLT